MDLSTTYLGLDLRTPLVASAGPPTESAGRIRRLEEAGIAAVVLPSLHEEDIARKESRADPDAYLDLVREAKEKVAIPVIGSLNGTTPGGWIEWGRRIEEAGADALELNVYYVPSDLELTAEEVERNYVEIVEAVARSVSIPVAAKMSPYFSSFGNMAQRLGRAGADGLVLFNRFYQPDLDLGNGTVFPHLLFSTQSDLRLPLRWIGLLHGRVPVDFAGTGGVYTGEDALKLIAVGAGVAMLCAALMHHGVGHVRSIEQEMLRWMEACGYESLAALRGKFSHASSGQPEAFERAQYLNVIATRPPSLSDP